MTSNYQGTNLRHSIAGLFCAVAMSIFFVASATDTMSVTADHQRTQMIA